MKKAIFGLAAVGAVIALRPVLKRRVVQKMQEHCRQMAVKCQEMMAGSSTDTGEARALPEHCRQLADQFREEEAVGTA